MQYPHVHHWCFNVVFAIIIDALIHLGKVDPTELEIRSAKIDFSFLLPFIGIGAYTIEGIGLIIPLRRDFIKRNSPQMFRSYYICTFMFIIFIYLLFGTANYLRFGSKTRSSIFYNYDSSSMVIFVLENLYAVVELLGFVFVEHDEHVYCL